jgi:hypothetical protein
MFRDEDGSFIGRCGLHRWRFEELDEVELGYVVRSELWGQGYATEMGSAVVRHAEEALGLNELVGFTMQDNPRSQHVLEKLGFELERPFVDEGENLVLYRRRQRSRRVSPPSSFAPDLSNWDAWRPEQVARRLEGVAVPWYVAAAGQSTSSSAVTIASTRISRSRCPTTVSTRSFPRFRSSSSA